MRLRSGKEHLQRRELQEKRGRKFKYILCFCKSNGDILKIPGSFAGKMDGRRIHPRPSVFHAV